MVEVRGELEGGSGLDNARTAGSSSVLEGFKTSVSPPPAHDFLIVKSHFSAHSGRFT
jgi:hypothetical protein